MAQVKERTKLLVDVSGLVGEDQQIDTPSLSSTSLSSTGLSSKGLTTTSLNSLGSAALGTLSAVSSRPKGIRTAHTHTPPRVVAERLAAKIRAVVPDDGETCYTLTHEYQSTTGEEFKNWNDSPFWLAADYRVLQDVYEWMNSEYEAIVDMMGYDERDHIVAPGDFHDGEILGPSIEELLEAWDMVAHDQEETIFLIGVYSREGIPVGHAEVSAGWLMGQLGLEKGAIIPTLIVARKVLPDDLAAIKTGEHEVTLGRGYLVKEIAFGEDYTTCYIEPK